MEVDGQEQTALGHRATLPRCLGCCPPAKLRPERRGPRLSMLSALRPASASMFNMAETRQCTRSSVFMKNIKIKLSATVTSNPAMSTWLVVKKLFVAGTTGRSGLCVRLFLHCLSGCISDFPANSCCPLTGEHRLLVTLVWVCGLFLKHHADV